VLAGFATRPPQPQNVTLPPAAMLGAVVKDERLSSDAALHLAWVTLSVGHMHPIDFDDAPADITWAIDMTLGVLSRSDVSQADKDALGRALGFVLQ
jgi:hypothetical protein